MLGPAGLPAPVHQRLAEAFRETMHRDALQARLRQMDTDPIWQGPEEFGATIARVRDIWIAGLDPATQDLFRITGWDEHGRPAFSPRLPEGRVYEIFWTDNLSQAPVTWHLLPEGAPMPPSSPVFFRVQVRVE